MPLGNLDHKKIYYYVISVMAFFVLMWGAIDLASSSIGLISVRASTENYVPSQEGAEENPEVQKGEQFFESYYQKKMLTDRFWDSFARLVISGAIFAYCRTKANRLEQAA